MPTLIKQSDVNEAKRKALKTQNPQSISTVLNTKILRQYCYSLTEWRNLRFAYFAKHPLDELSLLTDTPEVAEDIHHIISPFQTGKNLSEVVTLLLDSDNLIALTKKHHGQIHGHVEELTAEERKYLKERADAVREKYNWRF